MDGSSLKARLIEAWQIAHRSWAPEMNRPMITHVFGEMARDLHGGATILDLGCGSGFMVEVFRRAGLRSIGLDVEVGPANHYATRPLTCGSAECIPFRDETFHAVFADSIIQYTDRETVLRECVRVLRPGGLLITIENLRGHPIARAARAWVWLTRRHHPPHLVPRDRLRRQPPFRVLRGEGFQSDDNVPLCPCAPAIVAWTFEALCSSSPYRPVALKVPAVTRTRFLAYRPMFSALRAAVTVDLHGSDELDDIRIAGEALQQRGIRASFFIPSKVLRRARYRAAVLEVVRNGHEVAAHSHAHDHKEMRALMHGGSSELRFLVRAKRIHEDVFGTPPTAFRSPCWCHLGAAAISTLVDLGFLADSSATPQRFSLLSSTPYDDTWSLAPRRLHYLAPELLEVPTSTFLVPAGWPTFLTFRSFSRIFVKLLAAECRILAERVLTIQFHVSGFHLRGRSDRDAVPLSFSSFVPERIGGFSFRTRLRCADPAIMAAVTSEVLDSLRGVRFVSISDVALEHRRSSCAVDNHAM